jgi:hypothetical protein
MPVRLVAAPHERIALWTLASTLALALAFHACAETVFTLPANPLGERFRPLVLAYMHPYFEQSWNMFAPTPIDGDISVLARTRNARGDATDWVDLTAPLLNDLRAHPLSRYSTLKIAAMDLAVSAMDDRVLGQGSFTSAQVEAFADPRTRPMILDGLVRLGLFLGAGRSTHPRSVQVAIVAHRFPRFTHRFDADDRTRHNQTILFPWLPVTGSDAQAASS